MTFCRLVGLIAGLCLAPIPVSAEVYRCSEGGKTVYSDQPCVGDAVKVPIREAPLATGRATPVNLQNEADAGRIAIGMTTKQVEKAWGKPVETSTDQDAQGTTERWTYVRNGETTDIFIRNDAVSRIGAPRPAATGTPPPDGPPPTAVTDSKEQQRLAEAQQELAEEQERQAKAEERRFIREGMTINDVRTRIGPPASIKMSSDLWGVGTYWIYPPTPSDPQTRTIIRFNRDGGHVISVNRVVEY